LIGSSGLQIISRFPIKDVWFHRYRVNGKVYRVDHGDYHAGKGFGFARIKVSESQTFNVIVTHTIAQYNADDAYRADRLSQVWELVRFVQLISKPDQPIIIAGDMNSKPNSIEYNMFTKIGQLLDAYGLINSKVSNSATSMDVIPQRIDYIFFNKCKNWKLVDSKVVLNDKEILYSDHFGVSATFYFNNSLSKDLKNKKFSIESRFNSNQEVEEEEETFESIDDSKKLEKSILEQCSSLIMNGTIKAQKRKNKSSHSMFNVSSYSLGFNFCWISFILYWSCNYLWNFRIFYCNFLNRK